MPRPYTGSGGVGRVGRGRACLAPRTAPCRGQPWRRLAQAAGLQDRAFRALLGGYLLMDLRSQHYQRATGASATERISPLFWVVGQFLLVGAGVSVVLFARVDAFFFALAALAVSMVVVGTAFIVEFNEIVLHPDDLEIIGHQPVPARTYSAARLANLLAYVLLMTVPLNIFPALAGALILLYTTVLRQAPAEKVRDVLAWVQILLIMVFVYGGQAVFRDSAGRLHMFAYHLPAWAWRRPNWRTRSLSAPRPCCPEARPTGSAR